MTMPLSNQSDSSSIDQAFTVSVAVSASLKEQTFWSFAHFFGGGDLLILLLGGKKLSTKERNGHSLQW